MSHFNFPLKNDFCSVYKYLNFSAKNGPKIYIKIGYFCAEIQSIQIEQLKQFKQLNETFLVIFKHCETAKFVLFYSKEIGQFFKIGSHFLTESQFCLFSTGPISVTTEFKVRGSY